MRHLRSALFVLSVSALAHAESDLEAGERLFAEAKEAELRLDFGAALHDYDESLARAPSGRYALAAQARASDLRAHAEGGFAPLALLERSRRAPQTNESIDALERAADGFPDGPVRGEARMLGAEAYLDRLGRAREGEALFARVVSDPFAAPTLRRFAARRISDLAIARGDTEAAIDAARTADDADLTKKVAAIVRRKLLRRGAIAIVIATVALAGLAARARLEVARDAVRAQIGSIAAFALVIASGGVMATLERGDAAPFVALGASTALALVVARAWSAAGSRAPWARALRSALCAAAVVAAGFLVLDRIDPRYLDGFGL